MELYEQALKIIQDMALVMERSPEAFKSMGEEALRQHFLVQLNGQFEGKATAETFNMEGKTDILLREGDRNVFIAECKFWKGPKAFGEAIDQLLGYATWRDGKWSQQDLRKYGPIELSPATGAPSPKRLFVMPASG